MNYSPPTQTQLHDSVTSLLATVSLAANANRTGRTEAEAAILQQFVERAEHFSSLVGMEDQRRATAAATRLQEEDDDEESDMVSTENAKNQEHLQSKRIREVIDNETARARRRLAELRRLQSVSGHNRTGSSASTALTPPRSPRGNNSTGYDSSTSSPRASALVAQANRALGNSTNHHTGNGSSSSSSNTTTTAVSKATALFGTAAPSIISMDAPTTSSTTTSINATDHRLLQTLTRCMQSGAWISPSVFLPKVIWSEPNIESTLSYVPQKAKMFKNLYEIVEVLGVSQSKQQANLATAARSAYSESVAVVDSYRKSVGEDSLSSVIATLDEGGGVYGSQQQQQSSSSGGSSASTTNKKAGGWGSSVKSLFNKGSAAVRSWKTTRDAQLAGHVSPSSEYLTWSIALMTHCAQEVVPLRQQRLSMCMDQEAASLDRLIQLVLVEAVAMRILLQDAVILLHSFHKQNCAALLSA